jgi:hypothetical protein
VFWGSLIQRLKDFVLRNFDGRFSADFTSQTNAGALQNDMIARVMTRLDFRVVSVHMGGRDYQGRERNHLLISPIDVLGEGEGPLVLIATNNGSHYQAIRTGTFE